MVLWKEEDAMQTKVSPIVIGIAVVVLLVFCIFMYIRANSEVSPRQLPPSGEIYKPGYTGSSENAGPHNRPTADTKSGPAAGAAGH